MVISGADLDKEKHWQGILEQYKQSGLSGSQFCKQNGVSEHKFFYWKSTLAKRQKTKNQQKALTKIDMPFVPLKISNNTAPQGRTDVKDQIEITKITIKISANSDKAALVSILQSLEKA